MTHDMQDLINGRCGWCGTDILYTNYHDREWGRLVTDDRVLFEFLVLAMTFTVCVTTLVSTGNVIKNLYMNGDNELLLRGAFMSTPFRFFRTGDQ